jgi:hypothetical protein
VSCKPKLKVMGAPSAADPVTYIFDDPKLKRSSAIELQGDWVSPPGDALLNKARAHIKHLTQRKAQGIPASTTVLVNGTRKVC